MSNTLHYYHMLHSKSTCIFKKFFLDEFKRGEMVANSLLANINTMEVITAQKIKFSITLRSRIDVLPRLIFLEEKPRLSKNLMLMLVVKEFCSLFGRRVKTQKRLERENPPKIHIFCWMGNRLWNLEEFHKTSFLITNMVISKIYLFCFLGTFF